MRIRAAAAVAGSGPASSASDTSSSARSIASSRSPAGASAAPRSTIIGPPSVTTMLAARNARWASPARCSVCASRHTASSSSPCISSGARVSSCRPPTSSMAKTIEPSGNDMSARSSGQCHPFPPGQEEEQSFVLDRASERHCRPVVAGIAQEQRAVAAVEQVGVAAVPRVHLDEGRRVVGQRRSVDLGAPAHGTLEHQPGDVEAGPSQSLGDGQRARPAIGGTDGDEHGSAGEAPRGDGEEELGQPRCPCDDHRHQEEQERPVGRPPPGASQPGLADDGRRGDGGEVARRREPGRDQPGVVVQRVADGTGHADGPVDEEEGAGAGSGRHQEDDRAAPSLLDDEARGDDQRAQDGGDLGDSDGELTDGLWDQPGGLAEILAQTGVRALRQLDEQDQGDRRHAPGDDADDVAGVAVVPLAGRSFVEARLLRRRRGRPSAGVRRRAHVVPSRATAATTRNTSTTPSRSPP